jgi:hypothetical protein
MQLENFARLGARAAFGDRRDLGDDQLAWGAALALTLRDRNVVIAATVWPDVAVVATDWTRAGVDDQVVALNALAEAASQLTQVLEA